MRASGSLGWVIASGVASTPMYAPILASRYLRSRVIPLVAVAAVALCVALVIIVVSVMTGFLDMVKQSGRTLMGDVAISYQIRGLPRYERLIELLEARAEVHAAAPVIEDRKSVV